MSSLCDLCRYFSILFTEDENLVFRGNSFATKAMDSYMKMIGESVRWAVLFILIVTLSIVECRGIHSRVFSISFHFHLTVLPFL